MNLSEIIKKLLKDMHISIVEVADMIGQSPQNLGNKIRRGTLNHNDFTSIIEALGVKVDLNLILPGDNSIKNPAEENTGKINLLKAEIDFQARQIDYLRQLLCDLRRNVNIIYSCSEFINRNIDDVSRTKKGMTTISQTNIAIKNILDEGLNLSDLQPLNSTLEIPQYFDGVEVLVVDDNNLNLEITKEILTDHGFIVDVAKDGKEAIEKFKNAEPGYFKLIFMDLVMPNVDGCAASKAIRQLPGGDKVHIIAITANADKNEKDKALACGVDSFITKPFNNEQLIYFIKGMLVK